MRSHGLALGGSFENAVVVDKNRVLNAEGLRSKLEFVKHKTLDFIGDFGLLGARIGGKVFLYKAGHRLHADFNREVLKHLQNSRTDVRDSHLLAQAAPS